MTQMVNLIMIKFIEPLIRLSSRDVRDAEMPKASTPELKKFMDKRIFIQLNGSRKVVGTLRGYDVFP